jgi:hypothetical protein
MGLAEDFPDVVFADGIAENNEYFVLADDTPGKEDGVADALTFVLVHEMGRQLRIFLPHKILDLFPQVAYDKDKFVDSGLH